MKARAALGRRDFATANREIEAALRLAPESWEVNKDAATVFVWQHDYLKALPFYQKCVALFPEDLHSWDIILMCYRALGDQAAIRRNAEQMLIQAQAIVDREPNNQHAYARGANALVAIGDIAFFIADNNAVGIAIERDADVGLFAAHNVTQHLW